MADTIAAPPPAESSGLRWYQGIPKYAWFVLGIAAMGWLFDCMDQNLFNLVAQKSIGDLIKDRVPADQLQGAVNAWRGSITSIFLIGWSVGGFIFGIMGDKLGRTRTMVITILVYAIFTGMIGLAQSPEQYALFRFLTAMGVGGEFAAGVALVAEVFPNRSRPMALGLLQGLSAVGNMTAAMIVWFVGDFNWRIVFFIGALPALLVVWIRRTVKEPEKWQHAKEEASEDGARKELGNIVELWNDPVLRRNTIGGVLLAVAGVGGAWGVGFWLKDLMDIAFKGLSPETKSNWGSAVFLVQQVGAGLGMISFAAISERIGRKRTMGIMFLAAFLVVQGTFWFVNSYASAMFWAFLLGYWAFMPFGAYCVTFPEFYPTRLRTTGVGFCYNCARIFAAAAPFALGQLAGTFAAQHGATVGFRMAASIVTFVYVFGFLGLLLAPETKGKPLPE
jgi:MFS family permease